MVYGLGLGSIAKVFGKEFNERHYKTFNAVTRRMNLMPWKVDKQTLLNSLTDPDEREAVEYYFSEECTEGIAFAKHMKKQYFENLPNINNFLNVAQKRCKERGWVMTWTGRKRRFSDRYAEAYKAPNSIIQGGCGDILKNRLPAVVEYIQKNELDIKIVNLVHDEIAFEAPPALQEHIFKIREIMEDLHFSVPMNVDISYSDKSWGDKEELVV